MIKHIAWGVVLGGLMLAGSVRADMIIHFDQDVYNVLLGDSVWVEIVLDANDLIPGDQVLPEGLFSSAIEIGFNPQIAVLASNNGVELPNALNSNGIGGSPVFGLEDSGYARASGLVDFVQLNVYHGQNGRMWLVRFQLTGLEVGQTQLDLGLWKPLSNGSVLVNGIGQPLDDAPGLSFAPATLNVVVPEPSSVALLGLICGIRLSRRVRLRGQNVS